ncbi:M28 family metallopeptidase [Stigmatella aurantiaca]|uniref:Peptidase M20/M25/M40 family protein n=2 Tax=Stigmatella aurantiaca TaxID=41 RepID=Q08ZP2_STIAD|nr:M28 family metallopeptidase [Stigmatella aurantiaca]ADO68242.1 Peptidase M28 [Stigmatella aurantiaca DW4/3-1]EAU65925.1 peptidase M20/M25/M40 family protein [Stigmatella aurantiaca DW4/3-1]
MSLLRICACSLLIPALGHAKAPSLAAQRWWSHVEALASDGMEGRDTGSAGYVRAAEYVAAKLAEAGVQPGVGTGFLQEVPLQSRRLVREKSRLALVREGGEEPLLLGQDLILSPGSSRAGPVEAGLVFAGYGLTIPEAGHDDLAGLDLRGKVLVVLSGGTPPGVASNLAAHYKSREELARTYARAGVVGMLMVRNPRTQEMPWERAAGSMLQPAMMLAKPTEQEEGGIPLLGSINPLSADKLFAGSGHTFGELVALADSGKPMPRFALPASVRGHLELEQSQLHSFNVVGRLPGGDPALAEEAVVLTAHLDHVGFGQPVNGDSLYNGAMDNATGVAALLEVARSFQESKGRKPRRTILFVAVTAEEKGLLGSRWFAEHPPEGTGRVVANVNTDMFLPLTPLKRIIAYGKEESSLAVPLKASAARMGIEVLPDPNPDANTFVRSDQYSFIRQGVPALSLKFGYRKGSAEEALFKEWRMKRYHAPADDLSQPMDREAAVHFVKLLADLTQRIADAPSRPRWNGDSFFKRFESPPASSSPTP